jgi:V8-like Glu-specific endopeptidase
VRGGEQRSALGRWAARVGVVALLASILSGCGAEDSGDVAERTQEASLEHNRVLGFESPTSDWSTSNGSARAASTTVTEGSASLAVTPNGYTEVISIPVPAPGAARATATLDVRLPQSLGWGEARMVVRVPSQGHWWRDLGSQQLSGKAPGVFHSLSFTIPEDVRAALNSGATDVDYRIILNVPWGSGTYLLDNLVVSDQVSGGGTTPGPTSATELSIAVPRGLSVADVMISGTERVTIDDRSDLSRPGEISYVANLGASTLEFGAQVDAYANVTSIGDVNFLRSQSHTYGSVVTAGRVTRQDGSVRIDGAVTERANVQVAETRWSVDWPENATTDITRAPDSPDFQLEAGAYDSIQIFSRATVTLRSGTYFINSLVVEPQVKLRVDTSSGPVLIYVKDTLRLNVGLEYIRGERGQVLFAYLGNQSAYFEEAIVASVVAPNSVIDLRRPASGKPHEGSFFGKHVHVLSDATVLHLPFDFEANLCPAESGVNATNSGPCACAFALACDRACGAEGCSSTQVIDDMPTGAQLIGTEGTISNEILDAIGDDRLIATSSSGDSYLLPRLRTPPSIAEDLLLNENLVAQSEVPDLFLDGVTLPDTRFPVLEPSKGTRSRNVASMIGSPTCTGTQVGPRHIVTAAHCSVFTVYITLPGGGRLPWGVQPFPPDFQPAQINESAAGAIPVRIGIQVLYTAAFAKVVGKGRQTGEAYDQAIVISADARGDWLGTRWGGGAPRGAVHVGYPSGIFVCFNSPSPPGSGPWDFPWDRNCDGYQYTTAVAHLDWGSEKYSADYDSSMGQSGGPLFGSDARVAAVHSGRSGNRGAGSTLKDWLLCTALWIWSSPDYPHQCDGYVPWQDTAPPVVK